MPVADVAIYRSHQVITVGILTFGGGCEFPDIPGDVETLCRNDVRQLMSRIGCATRVGHAGLLVPGNDWPMDGAVDVNGGWIHSPLDFDRLAALFRIAITTSVPILALVLRVQFLRENIDHIG